MILKEKQLTNSQYPKIRSGEEAEKQMAFYLHRAFANERDYFVLNDLRLLHGANVAQIDHLIVTPYGLFIVESKSVHGKITVNEHYEWSRSYGNKLEGMPSPVLQANAQGEVLKQLLIDNREQLLGKVLFGKIQKGFKYCPILSYVAISDSGIIERKSKVDALFKADQIATTINKKIKALKTQNSPLSLSLEIWEIDKNETKNVAEFLLSRHKPLINSISNSSQRLIEKSKTEFKQDDVKSPSKHEFIPKVGAICSQCNQRKLVRKSVPRSDGTETDFLACTGYPTECRAIFPLVALIKKNEPVTNTKNKSTDVEKRTLQENDDCPRCKIGKLLKRKAKSEFLGCSQYPKCKFTDYRNQY